MKMFNKGFTLIELMIVVAIVGIFALLSLPYMASMFERTGIKTTLEVVSADLRLGKSEAIKRNSPVYFRMSSVAATGEDWCYGISTEDHCDCNETDEGAADYCNIKVMTANKLNGTSITGVPAAGGGVALEFMFAAGTGITQTIDSLTDADGNTVNKDREFDIHSSANNYDATVSLFPLGLPSFCSDNLGSFRTC